MESEQNGIQAIARFLVDHRMLLYVGALMAMSLPLGLVWLYGVELSPAARTTIVAVSFGVILVTYLAERRVGLDHADASTGAATPRYPLRMRVGVVLAIVGIAGGVFLALDGRPAVGLLFLVGAVFFLQMAYRSEEEADTG